MSVSPDASGPRPATREYGVVLPATVRLLASQLRTGVTRADCSVATRATAPATVSGMTPLAVSTSTNGDPAKLTELAAVTGMTGTFEVTGNALSVLGSTLAVNPRSGAPSTSSSADTTAA